jgi:hypothetical protein
MRQFGNKVLRSISGPKSKLQKVGINHKIRNFIICTHHLILSEGLNGGG